MFPSIKVLTEPPIAQAMNQPMPITSDCLQRIEGFAQHKANPMPNPAMVPAMTIPMVMPMVIAWAATSVSPLVSITTAPA